MMENDFAIRAGSIGGPHHGPNQDRYATATTPDAQIIVVCDGCGSAPSSQYGSEFISRFLCAKIQHFINGYGYSIQPYGIHGLIDFLWTRFRSAVSQHVSMLASTPGEFGRIIEDCFLATAHVLVVAEQWTFAFGSGDGVVWCNETTVSLDPPIPNAPAYPAYFLHGNKDDDRVSEAPFELYFGHRTPHVDFAGVATDGADDLIERSEETVRDGSKVGGIEHFRDEKYIKNPSLVGKRLRAVGEVSGKLDDDTTLGFAIRT